MTPDLTYLLVEDDRGQADLLSKWLKIVGLKGTAPITIEVLIEDNLESGLKSSQERKPSATFLDLLVPLRSGEEPVPENMWRIVADKIDGFVPPVIVTTGMTITPELTIYCRAKKAHRVFHKPYDAGFFAKLKTDTELFAAQLLSAATSAELNNELHTTGSGDPNGQQGTA